MITTKAVLVSICWARVLSHVSPGLVEPHVDSLPRQILCQPMHILIALTVTAVTEKT
jgi:hypothetical protein